MYLWKNFAKSTRMRNEILKVAAQQFAQYGFKKTTLTDIASSLGKQKTALYYYFKNKEDIFSEIIAIESQQVVNQLSEILNEDTDEVTRLQNYLIARIKIVADISDRFKVLKEELFYLMPEIEVSRAPYHLMECEELAKFLELGKEKGIFEMTSSKQMAITIVNILKGLEIPMYIREDMGYQTEELADFTSLIINGLVKDSR